MFVEYEASEGIAQVTLNRPERLNAASPQLVDDLCRALEHSFAEPIRAVILTGNGTSFCAGHDLKNDDSTTTLEEKWLDTERTQDVTRLLRRSPVPVIAAVRGYAVGAGCEFALCCDFVVATQEASFGFPEVSVGLSITGGISQILPHTVGLARARELVLLGERFTAPQAKEWGLIYKVVDDADLMAAAHELASTLAAKPRLALRLARLSLNAGHQMGLEAAMQIETNHAVQTLASEAAHVAAREFRSKV